MNPLDLTLYLATDRGLLRGRDLLDSVAAAIQSGVTLVQLREKSCTDREYCERATQLHRLTQARGIPLIVNDRVDIMLAVGAEGVHVGPEDLPLDRVVALANGRIVGYSVNDIADLKLAHRAGATYVGVGPVFATATKSDHRPAMGIEGLRAIVAQAKIPCVAIGGISPAQTHAVMQTGVAGVCVISAILGREDIGKAVRELRATQGKTPLPAP
ncbi:MAG: thiamine-phosphate diphosphorylase [Lentisphaerae bacterium RIFOXYB12_FULL_65_16]|nr:MAG: thiamine-phosphate diphosphorylase [Lentisphaerae bacterium RIFOXYA12_64_32]OGV92816.1 MAG: thiamine-phosphate diphosphorylase [Lentisphaerae bacterium RIFOXYB12_FULL_65_16]